MPAATTSSGSALARGQPECMKWTIVSAAAARAPVTKTELIARRTRREPAIRRALPMRPDIGKSSRSLEIRSRDSVSLSGGVGLRSPVEASVLGLAVVVSKRLKPGYEAKTSPIDLIRSWVIANVVWPPGAVDEK